MSKHFKTGKKFEAYRKDYDQKTGKFAEQRADLEQKIASIDEQITQNKVEQQNANADFKFSEYERLREEAKDLMSKKADMQAFLSRAIKVISEDEARTICKELDQEYTGILREFDKCFTQKVQELEDLIAELQPICHAYNKLDCDYQYGSTGKYIFRMLRDSKQSSFWNPRLEYIMRDLTNRKV